MNVKQRIKILSLILAILVICYGATFVFDSGRAGERSASHSWLDAKSLNQIDSIEIMKPEFEEGGLLLVLREGNWFAVAGETEYPAKPQRVKDLLDTLSRRESCPVMANSAQSHARLGVADDGQEKIILYAGQVPALTLLIGQSDATGREVYLRQMGRNEVRSGRDIFSSITGSSRRVWYDLRLLSGSDGRDFEVQSVQRIRVNFPPEPEAAPPPFTLSRNSGGWIIEGREGTINNSQVESYARSLLSLEGNDFMSGLYPDDALFSGGSIALEFGDGVIRTIYAGPLLEDRQRPAAVSSQPYIYLLAEWTLNRMFRNAEDFIERE